MAIVLKKDKMSEIERDIVKRQASCISNTSTSNTQIQSLSISCDTERKKY